MTDYLAAPPARALRGTLRVPPSKSATNRALLAAALSGAPVEIVRPLESDDTVALAECLEGMGAKITVSSDGLSIVGPLGGPRESVTSLDAEDSGTAARFLAAAAAAVPGRFRLTGSPRVSERPMGELVEALRRAGARVTYEGAEGFLPLAIDGGHLSSGEVEVDASRSSQFFSALLLAGLAVEGGLSVRASGEIASAPYVDTTLETLSALGHDVSRSGGAIRVRRGLRPAARYEVPGDYSSAVPLLCALAAAGGEIRLAGLAWPSADADARAVAVLAAMGLSVSRPDGTLLASSSGGLSPVETRATEFPDAVPALAAAAALAEGASRFTGIGHLRFKESDRIAAIAELVVSAGGRSRASADMLEIEGPARGPGSFAVLRTHRDHRIAMAAAVLAQRIPGLLIEDPGCVAKSYPAFFRDLESLRAS